MFDELMSNMVASSVIANGAAIGPLLLRILLVVGLLLLGSSTEITVSQEAVEVCLSIS